MCFIIYSNLFSIIISYCRFVAPNHVCHSFYCCVLLFGWCCWVFFLFFSLFYLWSILWRATHTHMPLPHRTKPNLSEWSFSAEQAAKELFCKVLCLTRRKGGKSQPPQCEKQNNRYRLYIRYLNCAGEQKLCAHIQCAPEWNVKYAFNCLQSNCKKKKNAVRIARLH